MISIDIAGHRFQLRAAAVIVHAGFVLLHRLEDDAVWALPGGRVEPGEDARGALEREMLEELEERIDSGELLYIVENFFEHAGRHHHELGMYFRAQLASTSPVLDKSRSHAGVEGGKRLEFRWFRVDRLEGVELWPSFLRSALAEPARGCRHVVERG